MKKLILAFAASIIFACCNDTSQEKMDEKSDSSAVAPQASPNLGILNLWLLILQQQIQVIRNLMHPNKYLNFAIVGLFEKIKPCPW